MRSRARVPFDAERPAGETETPRPPARAPSSSVRRRARDPRRPRGLAPRASSAMRGLFITGTDTGVGKTILSACAAGGDGGRGRARARLQAGRHRARTSRRRPADVAAGPRAARARGCGHGPATRSRRCATGRRSPRTWRRELAGEQIDPAALLARARAAADAQPARTLIVEGVGGLLVPLARGLQRCAISRPRSALPRADRRAARAGHDQPHAADARGRARGGAGRARGRAHAVAAGAHRRSSSQTATRSRGWAISRSTALSPVAGPSPAELARAGARCLAGTALTGSLQPSGPPHGSPRVDQRRGTPPRDPRSPITYGGIV